MSFVERLQTIKREQERQKRLDAVQKKKEKKEAARLKAEEKMRGLRESDKILGSIGAKNTLKFIRNEVLGGRIPGNKGSIREEPGQGNFSDPAWRMEWRL